MQSRSVEGGADHAGAVMLITAWLDGDQADHATAELCSAVRRMLHVDLSNVEIRAVLYDAVERSIPAEATAARLMSHDEASEGFIDPISKPR